MEQGDRSVSRQDNWAADAPWRDVAVHGNPVGMQNRLLAVDLFCCPCQGSSSRRTADTKCLILLLIIWVVLV